MFCIYVDFMHVSFCKIFPFQFSLVWLVSVFIRVEEKADSWMQLNLRLDVRLCVEFQLQEKCILCLIFVLLALGTLWLILSRAENRTTIYSSFICENKQDAVNYCCHLYECDMYQACIPRS